MSDERREEFFDYLHFRLIFDEKEQGEKSSEAKSGEAAYSFKYRV